MQLDKTHVVIRARTAAEIGDLSLVMIRRFPSVLGVGFLVGAAPWALVNALLLWPIPWYELEYGLDDPESAMELTRYLIWSCVLVFAQAPLAGLFATLFLGQSVFEQRPTWRSVFREGLRSLPRCLWALGGVRLAIPCVAWVAVLAGTPADTFGDVFVPIVLMCWMAIVRGSRPFLPEILLLEKCPLRSKRAGEITARRRSRLLHLPMASELSGRFLSSALVLTCLVVAFYLTLYWARGVLTGYYLHDFLAASVFFHLSLWAIAAASIVLRLLNYLDTRIRLEGWEVELAIRAEAIRQFGPAEETYDASPAAGVTS